MRQSGKHLSITLRKCFSAAIIPGLLMFPACRTNKMLGEFTGEAKAEIKPANGYGAADMLTDSSRDVLVNLAQNGDTVTLRFENTALLKKCELKARITKDAAYITGGTICETVIADLSRTVTVTGGNISVGDYENADVLVRVEGFLGGSLSGDYFTLRFEATPPNNVETRTIFVQIKICAAESLYGETGESDLI